MGVELEEKRGYGFVIRVCLLANLQEVQNITVGFCFCYLCARNLVDHLRDINALLKELDRRVFQSRERRNERCIACCGVVGASEAANELESGNKGPVRRVQCSDLQFWEVIALTKHIDADYTINLTR